MARGRHVWVDATMSTVGAATLARSLVDLDVLDDECILIQSLDLCFVWQVVGIVGRVNVC